MDAFGRDENIIFCWRSKNLEGYVMVYLLAGESGSSALKIMKRRSAMMVSFSQAKRTGQPQLFFAKT